MLLQNSNAISSDGYVIDNSLRFMSASSQYMTRTPSVAGNLTTWTWSSWIKITPGVPIFFINYYGSGTSNNYCYFSGSSFVYQLDKGTSYLISTVGLFRDPSAWYHVVFSWDSTQVAPNDRMRIFVNGVLQSVSGTQAPQNSTSIINANILQTIGRRSVANDNYADGYLSETHFIDGQALTPSAFGEINQVTGQWVAKKYTGTYGTNGFYLDFKDGTSTTTLGDDKSGNNNDWTLANFTRSAGVNDCWMKDVPAGNGSASAVQPSGNYAVLNPLSGNTAIAISGGNLISSTASATASQIPSSMELPKDLIYFEAVTTEGAGTVMLGVTSDSTALTALSSLIGYISDGTKIINGTITAYGASYTLNDVIGCSVDMVNGTITAYKNGVSQGTLAAGLSGKYWAVHRSARSAGTLTTHINFGQRSFAYTPPVGFKALCTANLPAPVITKPTNHFTVQLSGGANIKTDSESIFNNELIWVKGRASAINYQLIDSVRGTNSVLQSNTDSKETTYVTPTDSSVGWVWRAGDSITTNNDGDITSLVSVNTIAGFSIVSYTGTGVRQSVGHGLGVAPSVVIVKQTNLANSWYVYHRGISTTPQSAHIVLNSNATRVNSSSIWDAKLPTTSTFFVSGATTVNGVSNSYIAYCFADVEGYSKFGSYVGNGSVDGVYIYTGFTPKCIIIKRTTDGATDWVILDSARNLTNVVNARLFPNLANSESSVVVGDFLSNGIKLRDAGVPTNAVSTYIYMAFAESPFQYSNAR